MLPITIPALPRELLCLAFSPSETPRGGTYWKGACRAWGFRGRRSAAVLCTRSPKRRHQRMDFTFAPGFQNIIHPNGRAAQKKEDQYACPSIAARNIAAKPAQKHGSEMRRTPRAYQRSTSSGANERRRRNSNVKLETKMARPAPRTNHGVYIGHFQHSQENPIITMRNALIAMANFPFGLTSPIKRATNMTLSSYE